MTVLAATGMDVATEAGRRRTFAIVSHRDHTVNLLDTSGRRDLSEDTYRVLAAADAAVRVARRADAATAERLAVTTGLCVMARTDGSLLALFEAPLWRERLAAEHPDWTLDPIVTDGTVA